MLATPIAPAYVFHVRSAMEARMADKLSRGSLLKAASVTGSLGVLSACDGIALPGLTEQPAPPPAVLPDQLPSSSGTAALHGKGFVYEVQFSDEAWADA